MSKCFCNGRQFVLRMVGRWPDGTARVEQVPCPDCEGSAR